MIPLLLLLLVAGSGPLSPATLGPAQEPWRTVVAARPTVIRWTGAASYYLLENQRQANGERHRGRDLTCATRAVPFGDTLVVTRLDNGRSVAVVCEDRLGKDDPVEIVVDLSREAGRRLDMFEAGVVEVCVTVKRRNSGPL